jgi:uncharacterized protein HemX
MRRQGREQSSDGHVTKQVKEPTTFNGEMLLGIVGAGLAVGAAIAAAPVAALAVLPLTAIAATAAIGTGGFIGGQIGKGRMEHELDQARQQSAGEQFALSQSRMAARQAHQGMGQGVSLSEIEAARQQAPVPGGFAAREQERQAAMAQGMGGTMPGR